MIIEMKGLSQADIPTGCEAVSTVMILNYLGIEIMPETFIDLYLPKKRFFRAGDKLYGGNPEQVFAGSPYEKNSLGCFPKVILHALDSMKKAGYPGTAELMWKDISGSSLEQITEHYIEKKLPVLLWCTMEMSASRPGMQYYLKNGSLYTWQAGEHCMVLCGQDEKSYFFRDPRQEGRLEAYERLLTETRYREMGKRAVVIYKEENKSG